MKVCGESRFAPGGPSFIKYGMLTFFWGVCRVSKGTPVFVSIIAINRDKSIWGEDAMEFKWVSS